jgi:hypothetical protein
MAFPLLYVAARAWGLGFMTVYPSFGIVLFGMHRSRDVADPALEFLAPEMWWYGWVATAAIGALAVGLMAALVPGRWRCGLCAGLICATMVIAMLACVYLTIPWFRLCIK